MYLTAHLSRRLSFLGAERAGDKQGGWREAERNRVEQSRAEQVETQATGAPSLPLASFVGKLQI